DARRPDGPARRAADAPGRRLRRLRPCPEPVVPGVLGAVPARPPAAAAVRHAAVTLEGRAMPQTVTRVGPADNGRRMSLAEFESAEGQPGYLYELSRGVVTVVDVPNLRHFAQFNAIRRQLTAYDLSHPDVINAVGGGGECKVLLTTEEGESERHPDVAVYKEPPPAEDVWATWIPDLVIEIVSPGSEHRDYVEKAQDYLVFGVREYWIVDEAKGEVLVLRRRGGRWVERIVRPPEVYTTTVLPGFAFDCAAVFEAARAVGA